MFDQLAALYRQMRKSPRTTRTRKWLKTMVPPARLERTTPGLGKRMQMKMQMIDMFVIAETGVGCHAFTLSNQFPFVS